MGVAAGVAVAGLCGGCGGDSVSADTTAATPLSRVVAAGDALCAKGNQQIGALETPAFDPAHATPAQLRSAAPYLRKMAAIVATEVDGAAAVGTPDQKADEFSAAIADARRLADGLGDQATAAEKGDVEAFQRAERDLDANPAGRELAALGFTVCGQG